MFLRGSKRWVKYVPGGWGGVVVRDVSVGRKKAELLQQGAKYVLASSKLKLSSGEGSEKIEICWVLFVVANVVGMK
jgi:hypothetical protein